jgi:monothiol glutaredoxin
MDEQTARKSSTIDGNDVVSLKGDPTSCGVDSRLRPSRSRFAPVDYVRRDVLADSAIRRRDQRVLDWPTIPQLYVRKEFVGGATSSRVRERRAEESSTEAKETPSANHTVRSAAKAPGRPLRLRARA